MSAAEIVADLARHGIRLEADGERLRYFPRSALTPDLLGRLKAHKPELLALLRTEIEREPEPFVDPFVEPTGKPRPSPGCVCRCGSPTWRDVPVHDGQSVRRDCGRCRRFLDFPVWYGKNTGHNVQYPI